MLLDDRRESDTIVELRNTALYYGRLMSHYGFDMKSGKWDTKQYPVTKNDKEMIGINSDRLRFNLAVQKYNNYIEYLSRKYHLKLFDRPGNGFLYRSGLLILNFTKQGKRVSNRKQHIFIASEVEA
jgi:hypothetical protein